jgi:hypothetical protein
MGGLNAASTEPDADQRQIGHAGPQQHHRQRDGQAFAGGLKDRSGHGENIGRFYPESLGQYFLLDSGLVYDSRTPAQTAANPLRLAHFPIFRRPTGAETLPLPVR